MNSNVRKLGEVLNGRMVKTAKAAVPTTLELGSIAENLSLITDSIKTPIRKGGYMVSRLRRAAGKNDTSTQTTQQPIQEGDRVLVLWSGNIPVVFPISSSGIEWEDIGEPGSTPEIPIDAVTQKEMEKYVDEHAISQDEMEKYVSDNTIDQEEV